MARAVRSNSRIDLIVLGDVRRSRARGPRLPNTMREPVATGMRAHVPRAARLLQERSEKRAQSLLSADAKQAATSTAFRSRCDQGRLARRRERPAAEVIGLGSRLRWGFVPAEALHGRGVRDETTRDPERRVARRRQPSQPRRRTRGSGRRGRPGRSHDEPRDAVDAPGFPGERDVARRKRLRHRAGASHRRRLARTTCWSFAACRSRATLKPGARDLQLRAGAACGRGEFPIGTVLQEIKTTEGWARTYLLRPAVNPARRLFRA